MRNAKRTILIAMLICVGLTAAADRKKSAATGKANQKWPSVDELLDKIEKSQNQCDKIKSYILKYEISGQGDCSFMGPGKRARHEYQEYYTDGKRFYKSKKVWGNCMKGEDLFIPKDDPKLSAWLWDGKLHFFWGKSSAKFAKHYAQRKYKKTAEREHFLKRKMTGSTTIARKNLSESRSSVKSFVGLKMGYLMGDVERIDKVLRQAEKLTLKNKMPVAGNSRCYVLRAKSSKYGTYEVWIDPEHGYNIAKAKLYKGPNHKKITAWLVSKGTTIKYQYDNVKFKKIDGMWIPVEADRKYDEQYASGDYNTSATHYKRTEVVLNPEFDEKTFVPKIPNGYSVSSIFIEEDAGEKKNYTWQGGSIVDDDGNKLNMKKIRSEPKARK
jgi:hypothetical protein